MTPSNCEDLVCCAFGYNPDGEPDIWFGLFRFKTADIDTARHYRAIKLAAEHKGYDVALVCDAKDPAGNAAQLVEAATLPLLDASDLKHFKSHISEYIEKAAELHYQTLKSS